MKNDFYMQLKYRFLTFKPSLQYKLPQIYETYYLISLLSQPYIWL